MLLKDVLQITRELEKILFEEAEKFREIGEREGAVIPLNSLRGYTDPPRYDIMMV